MLGSSGSLLTRTKTDTGKRQRRIGKYFRLFLACIMIAPMLLCGCKGRQVRSISQEAYDFFNQRNYEASLKKYAQIIETHPQVADRVLFEMGIIYAYPNNAQKDYQKSLECFQKIVRNFPESDYRLDSQMMILHIQNVIIKDKIIARQQTQIERSKKEIKDKENEIVFLQENIDRLENRIFALRTEPADKVLIEKEARRLTLLSMGEVIKIYKIAIGGNPIGPKEKRGDNKTPEGTYIIDSRNSESDYHLSLHISYPNERDKMRAKALGVSPGGDIMIHGVKNGHPWAGAYRTEFDWTKGCIAVTNEEMEEIYKLVPNGTIVEIRP
jgi:lipoprotein-anchoring transpeptidase ErfK/SrfK